MLQKSPSFLSLLLIAAACFFLSGIKVQAQIPSKKTSITNGGNFTDTQGNLINAHGGGFLKVGKYYYWIGENRHNDVLVSCYRSTDLINWEFRGDLLTRKSNPELANANIERPKVIYNDATGQFVMWMHYEISSDYSYARAAVATSPDIEKPFTYLKSFRPFENMSRDCNLYKDQDGTAYFISSTRENRDMNVYELSKDYLTAKSKVATLWPDAQREAPTVLKRGDYYFMLSSFCTGWDPNQAKYAFSKNMRGPWSALKNIGSPMSYDTQPTFILPVEGEKETSYLYLGDRWDPSEYFNSKPIFLPLTFANDTTMEMQWASELTPDTKTGDIVTRNEKPTQYRIKSKWTGKYLILQRNKNAAVNNISDYRLSYTQTDLRWQIEPIADDYVRLLHVTSGKYIESTGKDETRLVAQNDSDTQQWKINYQKDGWCKLINKATGKALSIDRSQNKSDKLLVTTLYQEKYDPFYDKQAFLLAPVYE